MYAIGSRTIVRTWINIAERFIFVDHKVMPNLWVFWRFLRTCTRRRARPLWALLLHCRFIAAV